MRKPDSAKTYGRPRIPAPIIVPVSVNAVDKNFLLLFIISFRFEIGSEGFEPPSTGPKPDVLSVELRA